MQGAQVLLACRKQFSGIVHALDFPLPYPTLSRLYRETEWRLLIMGCPDVFHRQNRHLRWMGAGIVIVISV